MRIITEKRKAGEIEFGIIYGIIALLAVVAARLLPLAELAPACVFRSLTGLSCPTCGVTRSLAHFSHGELGMALCLNPLFAAGLLLTFVYFVANSIAALLKFPRIAVLTSSFERNIIIALAWILLAANWAYLLARS